MQIIEQISYVEGATENCKDLISKSNRILKELSKEKVLKMRRGIEQDFVDVVHEGKRMSEDWEDTKTIFAETFYQMINKYLFDKMDAQNSYFVNQMAFINNTMVRPQAGLKEVIYFLVNNFLLKEDGQVPVSEVPRIEGHPEKVSKAKEAEEKKEKIIKVKVDEDGDSIVTYESGRKEVISKLEKKPFIISNNPTPAVEFPQVENTVEQNPTMGLVHNHAPNPSLHGNEAIVSAHENDTIDQPSNSQNPISMLKRTAEQVAPTVPVADTEKKLLTIGEKFIGVGFNPSGNENVDAVKTSFSEMADYLFDMEQSEEIKNDQILRDLHTHAKQALLSASMTMVRVITYKK